MWQAFFVCSPVGNLFGAFLFWIRVTYNPLSVKLRRLLMRSKNKESFASECNGDSFINKFNNIVYRHKQTDFLFKVFIVRSSLKFLGSNQTYPTFFLLNNVVKIFRTIRQQTVNTYYLKVGYLVHQLFQ